MSSNALPEAKSRKSSNAAPAFSPDAVAALAAALNGVLADSVALYLKTKNFHWHVSGPHFRDYHLMFDEQAAQILAGTDGMAERVRKIGGTTRRSIGHIAKLQRRKDNDASSVPPGDMLDELMADNQALPQAMRQAHHVADEHGDVATASLFENWIDEAELRAWFLIEALRPRWLEPRLDGLDKMYRLHECWASPHSWFRCCTGGGAKARSGWAAGAGW